MEGIEESNTLFQLLFMTSQEQRSRKGVRGEGYNGTSLTRDC
jgi:hypothetical protein